MHARNQGCLRASRPGESGLGMLDFIIYGAFFGIILIAVQASTGLKEQGEALKAYYAYISPWTFSAIDHYLLTGKPAFGRGTDAIGESVNLADARLVKRSTQMKDGELEVVFEVQGTMSDSYQQALEQACMRMESSDREVSITYENESMRIAIVHVVPGVNKSHPVIPASTVVQADSSRESPYDEVGEELVRLEKLARMELENPGSTEGKLKESDLLKQFENKNSFDFGGATWTMIDSGKSDRLYMVRYMVFGSTSNEMIDRFRTLLSASQSTECTMKHSNLAQNRSQISFKCRYDQGS
ncbi:MAG: hypothetical protein HQL50_02795 [Magnetococcales bacterium]|nr:hypothetical protein [Magnetococcales bacterium]